MAAEDASSPFVLSNGIQKSFKDDRSYRHLVLPNKLQVLLVSSPDADKAAAAMCVKVGHFSDPDELPGLAHFCEHMLFLGTKKYPDENSYSAYLNKHGGWSNAYTASEDTNYFFELQHEHLEEALDRFAQFFIAPLFTESCVSRERNAVHSENTKNLQNDMWRLYQLSKSTSKPDHAYHKFGTGNLETLKDTPEAAGINVRDELLKFHETYYSANVMRLAIVGRNSLDELEAWAREKFSDIRNTDRSPPAFPGQPIGPEQLGLKSKVVPVKDSRKLIVEWPMPPVLQKYKSKPSSYLSHLVGHEGGGSLLSLLKARNYATELMAGPSENDSSFSIFGCTITLTPAGLENVDEVIKTVMQYVAMLRREGPKKWVWDECQATAAIAFRYKSKENPGNYATSLARQMHVYETEHTLSGPSLFFDYDEAAIRELLDCFTVENMRCVVVSQSFADEADQEERWYKTKYKSERFTPEQLAAWGAAAEEAALHLPPPNDFIATDFTLRYPEPTDKAAAAATEEAAGAAAGAGAGAGAGADASRTILGLPVPEVIAPDVVREDELTRLWYLADKKFFQPKIVFTASLRTPVSGQSPRDLAMTKVYTKLVKEALNEFAYSATLASLAYGISSSNQGMSVEVSGFNHKLPVLLNKVADRMANLEFSDEEFERIRDLTEKEFKNFAMEQPYTHSIAKLGSMTESPRWSTEEQLEEVKTVSADEQRAFCKRMLRQTFFEGLVYGNATPEDAKVLFSALVDPFVAAGSTPLHASQFDAVRVVRLPAGVEFVNTSSVPNPDETNSAIEVYFQVGPFEPRMQAALSVVANIMREPCFDELRTKGRLGYIVHSSTKSQYGVNGLRLIVQSTVLPPTGLDCRIEMFLANFRKTLEELPADTFAANCKAVAAQLLEVPKRPSQVAQPLWYEIKLGRYAFSRTQEQAEAVEALTKEQCLAFFDHYFAAGGAGRRKASSYVVAACHADVEASAAAGGELPEVPADDAAAAGEGEGAGAEATAEGKAEAPEVSELARAAETRFRSAPRLALAEGLAVVQARQLDAAVCAAGAEATARLAAAAPVIEVGDDIAALRKALPLFGSTERAHNTKSKL